MAEFVQLRKEKWMDPLSGLQELGLFNKSELGQIISKVETYEYKIQTPNRKLEDVLGYIEFESSLLKTIQNRRKEAEQFERTDEIDRFIFNEITSQFGSAEINFQHSYDYWNARLMFIAKVVPNENREVEFNRIFRKALDYCGRAHFELYRDCVDFLWNFLSSFTFKKPVKKKAKMTKERRNVSRIMSTIREITKDALRNFSRSAEAHIWVITTELHYLTRLRDEEELSEEALQEETEKTDNLIRILCKNFVNNFNEVSSYFQFFEAVKEYDVPQATQLFRKAYNKILEIQPRTLEIHGWLISKSLEERKIDECLERVSQALSSQLPRIRTLNMCLEKLDVFFDSFGDSGNYDEGALMLFEFYTHLLDKENGDWSEVKSENYHISRIKFIKTIQRLQLSVESTSTDKSNDARQMIAAKVASFSYRHPLKATIMESVKKFPNSFYLVRERILIILSDKGDSLKTAVIFKYLKELNLERILRNSNDEKKDEVYKLLYVIYYAFISSKKLSKVIDKLFMIPGTDAIKIIHLRKLYLESIDAGRQFYDKFRCTTSDWKFAVVEVEIETNICRSGTVSKELHWAIEDATRLAQASSTEPWKTCILSLRSLKKEKEASELFERFLKYFSAGKGGDVTAIHKDILLLRNGF